MSFEAILVALVGIGVATLWAALIAHNNDIIVALFAYVFGIGTHSVKVALNVDTPFGDSLRTVMTALEGEWTVVLYMTVEDIVWLAINILGNDLGATIMIVWTAWEETAGATFIRISTATVKGIVVACGKDELEIVVHSSCAAFDDGCRNEEEEEYKDKMDMRESRQMKRSLGEPPYPTLDPHRLGGGILSFENLLHFTLSLREATYFMLRLEKACCPVLGVKKFLHHTWDTRGT